MSHIYCLINPINGDIRYVGKTTNSPTRRLAEHIRNAKKDRSVARHRRLWSWIKSLDQDPIIGILEEDPEDLNEAERKWIALLSQEGLNLCNMTEGGDGQSKGYVPSEETRRKNSESNKGRQVSEETRQKLSEIHKGKPKSEEHKAKLSVAKTGTKLSDEKRKQWSEDRTGEGNSFYGKKHSEETKAKIREAANSPERLAALAEARTRVTHHKWTPEQKKRMSEATIARHERTKNLIQLEQDITRYTTTILRGN